RCRSLPSPRPPCPSSSVPHPFAAVAAASAAFPHPPRQPNPRRGSRRPRGRIRQARGSRDSGGGLVMEHQPTLNARACQDPAKQGGRAAGDTEELGSRPAEISRRAARRRSQGRARLAWRRSSGDARPAAAGAAPGRDRGLTETPWSMPLLASPLLRWSSRRWGLFCCCNEPIATDADSIFRFQECYSLECFMAHLRFPFQFSGSKHTIRVS
ncbi:unnamed protein product, partial [Urochloa humidicola]